MYSTIGPRFQKILHYIFRIHIRSSADVGRAKQKGTVESQLGMSGIGKPSHIQRM